MTIQLAQRLFAAAAVLQVALRSGDAQAIAEARVEAAATIDDVRRLATDGGVANAGAAALNPLLQQFGALIFASLQPDAAAAPAEPSPELAFSPPHA